MRRRPSSDRSGMFLMMFESSSQRKSPCSTGKYVAKVIATSASAGRNGCQSRFRIGAFIYGGCRFVVASESPRKRVRAARLFVDSSRQFHSDNGCGNGSGDQRRLIEHQVRRV